MKEQLIAFKTAILAKEKGFNERVFLSYYTPDKGKTHCVHKWDCDISNSEYITARSRYSAPTQSLLQKWLRDKHKFHVFAVREEDDWIFKFCEFSKGNKTTEGRIQYNTYEKALEFGLQFVLKTI